RDKYESELRQGDEHALLATTRGTRLAEIKHQLGLALASYNAASAAKPDEAEPYFRIGRLLYSFYFECNDATSQGYWSPLCVGMPFSRQRAEQVIAAWDAFEARAPLDPRLS